ncbi:MAG: hypothetical protein AVDCRST_MAG74-261, partial [uncultured Pyrinomonadaceae bacterium]
VRPAQAGKRNKFCRILESPYEFSHDERDGRQKE